MLESPSWALKPWEPWGELYNMKEESEVDIVQDIYIYGHYTYILYNMYNILQRKGTSMTWHAGRSLKNGLIHCYNLGILSSGAA